MPAGNVSGYAFADQKRKQKNILLLQDAFWCGRWDLNPYVIQHTPLKRACLPIPALPHMQLMLPKDAPVKQRIYYIQIGSLCQYLCEKILNICAVGQEKGKQDRLIQ